MRSVPAHQQVIEALLHTPEAVRIPVTQALGLVTAVPVQAPLSLPTFDNSAMDGFAVRAADVAAATPTSPVQLPVTADIPAGRTDHLTLTPGTAHRIMTGAPLPEGADAVVPVEHTSCLPGPGDAPTTVTITTAAQPGRHIRRAGSDIVAGQQALPAGMTIAAPQIGLLYALGIESVTVIPRLRVTVLSTGTELITPGTDLAFGQIYESNGAMLAAAVTSAGACGQHLHAVADDVEDFIARIEEAAADTDLIITSGGVSAGAFEVVKEALSASADCEFVKVAMQPGMPQGSGIFTASTGRRVPIITLPGNPVSALVSFEVFIRPPLRAAMGLPADRRRITARLDSPLQSPKGKRQFLRGMVTGGDDPVVDPIGPPASHHLRYLAAADALIDIDPDTESIPAGGTVNVWLLTDRP